MILRHNHDYKTLTETKSLMEDQDEEGCNDEAVPTGPVPVHIHLGIDEHNGGGNLLLA